MFTYLAGDRSMSNVYLPLVAIEMLRAQALGNKLVTHNGTGVASLVRELAQRSGVEVMLVDADAYPTQDALHTHIASLPGTEAVLIHAKPHSSSVIKSACEAFGDDDLRIVTHADLQV